MFLPLLYFMDSDRPARTVGARDVSNWPPPPRGRGRTLAGPKDMQELKEQRWGLIVPAGHEHRAKEMALLSNHREEQQEAKVKVFSFPPKANLSDWVIEVFGEGPTEERPRYALLLGDFDELPLELAIRLSMTRPQTFVGRVCFDVLQDYNSYARKVVAAETSTVVRPGLGVYGPVDGTEAMEVAHQTLLAPLRATREKVGRVPWTGLDPRPGQPLGESAAAEGQVLLTVCHGLAREHGWPDAETQRLEQGNLRLWAGRSALGPAVAAAGEIVPRGFWLMHACFAAGTPARSLYRPHVDTLDLGIRDVGQPVDGRGFVASVPKALLANPDGPLGVLSHVDIAWSFAMQDIDRPHRRLRPRWDELAGYLESGVRIGSVADHVTQDASDATERLLEIYDEANPSPDEVDVALLRLQMMDLRAFTLLGDPAARLNV